VYVGLYSAKGGAVILIPRSDTNQSAHQQAKPFKEQAPYHIHSQINRLIVQHLQDKVGFKQFHYFWCSEKDGHHVVRCLDASSCPSFIITTISFRARCDLCKDFVWINAQELQLLDKVLAVLVILFIALSALTLASGA
jgi:hypothetical protein